MLKLFRIEGSSLFPILRENDLVLCIKIFSFTNIKLNNLVLFNHEKEGMMIKRVHKINNNSYFLIGENAFSIDSRNFGEVKKSNLLYKVIYKF